MAFAGVGHPSPNTITGAASLISSPEFAGLSAVTVIGPPRGPKSIDVLQAYVRNLFQDHPRS
jgi:hypothetical protein